MEERNLEKIAKLSLSKKVGLGLSVAFGAPTIIGGVKKGLGEFASTDATKDLKKAGFKYGTKPLHQNMPEVNSTGLDNTLNSTALSQFKQAQEDNSDNHFKDAYKFLPAAAALTLAGTAAMQVKRGKLDIDDVLKPVKQVGKSAVKPYKTITNFGNVGKNIANKYRTRKDLEKEFARYVTRTGDTELSEEGFKALWKAFHDNKEKVYRGNNYDFDTYIKDNKERLFKKFVYDDARTNMQTTRENLKGGIKKFMGPLKTTFDDGLNGFVVGGAIGTGLTLGSLAMNATGDEYYKRKDNAELRKAVRNNWNSNATQKTLFGKDNQLEPNGLKYYTPEEKIEQIIRDEVRQTAKKELRKQNQYYQNQRFNNSNRTNNRRFNNQRPNKKMNNKNIRTTGKIMNPQINSQLEKSAASLDSKKAKAAHEFLKQNVIGNSITSLAYAASPAVAFGLMNRDRYNFQKIDNPNNPNNKSKTNKTVLEFKDEDSYNNALNKNSMEKDAGFDKVKKVGKNLRQNLLPDDIGRQIRDNAMRGLTNTIPVAMIAGATNRNWRGNMERFDSEEYAQNVARPLERGNIRITIERGDDKNNG